MRGNLALEAREAVLWMWVAFEKGPNVRLAATSEALRQIEEKGYRIGTDIFGYIDRVEAVL